MKKIIFLLTLVVFAYSESFAQQPIKTIEKKYYYDIYKRHIESIIQETADGRRHGECKGYYESGVLKIKAIYYLGSCLSESQYYQTGELYTIFNKNKTGEYDGEQKIYKTDNGVHELKRYAKLINGKVIEFSYDEGSNGKFMLKDNIFKIYDKDDKVIFKIENGKINGTLGLNPSNEEFYKLCLWGCNHFIQFEDNKFIKYIGEDYDKNFEYNYNFEKNNFTYTEKNKENGNVIKGFYKPQENFDNKIKLLKYEYIVNNYELPKFLAFEFNYKDYASDIPSYCKKDSIWSTFKNEKLIKEETYKNGERIYFKEFNNYGVVINSPDIDKMNEEIKKASIEAKKIEKELNKSLRIADQKILRSMFFELTDDNSNMSSRNWIYWKDFRETAYAAYPQEINSNYKIYYNVECKKVGNANNTNDQLMRIKG